MAARNKLLREGGDQLEQLLRQRGIQSDAEQHTQLLPELVARDRRRVQ